MALNVNEFAAVLKEALTTEVELPKLNDKGVQVGTKTQRSEPSDEIMEKLAGAIIDYFKENAEVVVDEGATETGEGGTLDPHTHSLPEAAGGGIQ